ncbi:hypothetical protein ACH5RR_034116 [Cinchona calisaya]|uniref:Protein kinase domain-containing protein n=1 Tax=Cinchona calisaya TaxID=153742 RepID=A0ABD2YAT0_9GENT
MENGNEKFLVSMYMSNKDLSSSLYSGTLSKDVGLSTLLDWITRLKIATGAAESLCYLHHECVPPLIHRDIQASSILLDDKLLVKLGSLCGVCTEEDISQNWIAKFLQLPKYI